MPYHIGEKNSNGCSGYPVVSDKGHVAGCHATEAEATAQLGALYANVSDAKKGEASIEISSTLENPSSSINPDAGMKKPQYGYNQARPTGSGIHNKPGVDIWQGSFFGKAMENEMLPTPTEQDCQCETCKEYNINCNKCPECGFEMMDNNPVHSELGVKVDDESLGRSLFNAAKDYSRDTRTDILFRE